MLHWVFLSVLATGGGGGAGGEIIYPEIAISRSGGTFVKFHSQVDVQLFCKLDWSYGDEFFWLRPRGASEWHQLELPYEIVCGSFVNEPDDGVQLGGPDIEQGG